MPAKTELDELVEKLKKALGTDLLSVVLYGSAVTGDHNENFSDYNVLCILNQVTPVELAASERVFRWWKEKGNPSPLLLTAEEVTQSADCFAIEFHDIRAHHRILFGEDLVTDLAIDNSFYRAQVEHDLRAKLLRLRQKASGILSDKDVLRRLLLDSVSTFCVLFRHALILHGEEATVRKREIIEGAQRHFGIDPAPFMTLLDRREERVKADAIEPAMLLAKYMKEIEKVIGAVDRLARGKS
ncbi:MAG: nucleotidyltransferase domain-containing protein [Terriglobia bacterium]